MRDSLSWRQLLWPGFWAGRQMERGGPGRWGVHSERDGAGAWRVDVPSSEEREGERVAGKKALAGGLWPQGKALNARLGVRTRS